MMLTMNGNNGLQHLNAHKGSYYENLSHWQLYEWLHYLQPHMVLNYILCTVYKQQLYWRADFPEWCFRCSWEEGRADGQQSLSLINKPQQCSGVMPLFDKQERHCLRISTLVVKWPYRGLREWMWGGSKDGEEFGGTGAHLIQFVCYWQCLLALS